MEWGFRFGGVEVLVERWAFVSVILVFFAGFIYLKNQEKEQLNQRFLLVAVLVAVIIVYVSLFVHELAHLFLGNMFGSRITEMKISWWGIGVRSPTSASPLQELVIFLIGPFSNLWIVCFINLLVRNWSESLAKSTLKFVSSINLNLAIINFLPLSITDGGKALKSLAVYLFPPEFRVWFCSIVSAGIFFCLGGYCLYRSIRPLVETKEETPPNC